MVNTEKLFKDAASPTFKSDLGMLGSGRGMGLLLSREAHRELL